MTKTVTTELKAYNFNFDDFILSSLPPLALNSRAAGQSFMHDLAREGDVLSAEVMFESGTPIDIPNDIGRHPLHEAAAFGQMEMVKFLLDCGAEADAPVQPLGHTALYLAVEGSWHDIARHLIKHGASLAVTDALLGTGLLHAAAAKGDMLMAGILIAAGADIFHADKKGMTARDTAERHGHKNLSHTLLKVMEHHARHHAAA